jgi:hypothetical protein
MDKKQQIGLGAFLGLFVIPELLWSPIVNFFHALLQNSNQVQVLRPNYFTDSDNLLSFLILVLVQFLGLVAFLYLINSGEIAYWKRIILSAIIILLIIPTVFVLYAAFTMRNGIGF